MGKKDDYQYEYLDDNARFADQINGALFGGKQVVRAEELEPEEPQVVNAINMEETGDSKFWERNGFGVVNIANTESTGGLEENVGEEKDCEAGEKAYTVANRKKKNTESIKTIVDKARIWRGRKLHILVVENQNYVDYRMVLRNMLSESNGYLKQWKQKKRIHTAVKDLKDGDEYLSGMKKDEKFAPIITLVVYFGTERPWDGAKCLYDLLDIDDELKEYVTNYRLNLYDCQAHDTFDEYQTGLRQVFETVRYSNDKEKLRDIMEQNREAYSKIDSETKDILKVVANIEIPDRFKTVEKGEERYDMCKAFEDMRQEGYEDGMGKGIEKGIRILIQAYQELGMSRDVIIQKCAEKFDIALESAGKYVEEYCI